jgi:hypothetical protein
MNVGIEVVGKDAKVVRFECSGNSKIIFVLRVGENNQILVSGSIHFRHQNLGFDVVRHIGDATASDMARAM